MPQLIPSRQKGMHNTKSSSILAHSLEIVALARPLVDAVQRRDRDLASQLRRAISSVTLNLAEGFGSASGNARVRFESARGSLSEAQAGIRVALTWGYVTQTTATPVLESMHSLGGRVFGLCRR